MATATAHNRAVSIATKLRNLPARSRVSCVPGRPDASVSMRKPSRLGAASIASATMASNAPTAAASPATAIRQRTRLAGCTSCVASISAKFTIARGEKLENPPPRSDSMVSTCAIRSRALPKNKSSPTSRPKASSTLASAHTVPGNGPRLTGRSLSKASTTPSLTLKLPRRG